MQHFDRGRVVIGLLAVALAVVIPSAAYAQRIQPPTHPLDHLAFSKDELWVPVQAQNPQSLGVEMPRSVAEAFQNLQRATGKRWSLSVDRITGRPALMEGEGIPWIPGTANLLRASDLGLPEGVGGRDVPVAVAVDRAKAFVDENPELFGVDAADLTPNLTASGPMLDYLYWIQLDWSWRGVPVEGAGLSFGLNHGNLVQVGQSLISDAVRTLDPRPTIPLARAWDLVLAYAAVDRNVEITDPGKLRILPVSNREVRVAESFSPGSGIDYRLVWILAFRAEEAGATWEARVDAHNGEILAFLNTTRFGHVQGGVHLTDNYPADTSMPFPYANYSGTTNFADVAGNFPGTAGTSTLVGDLVRITDYCGAISKLSDASGLIDFGANTGNDCSTPGTGGAGNTRSARTQYWHVTSIKIKARTYMPANNWLGNQLLDRTNMTSAQSIYCPGNAWWDGTNLNFCVSGGGYGNTGELPGVSLHEWGHGMDSNDGRAPADNGTGETYGDFSAVLQTHQSCVGGGFDSTNCSGYGDGCKTCRGIRDIDWGAHQSGVAHTPFDLDDASGYRCGQYGWPYTGYEGPCRYEGHCESYVSSEGLWDLAVRDLPAMGIDATSSWQIMDRLWYASRPTGQAAYACTATNPTGAVTAANGGNTGSFYNVFRVVDDCDGNLANGTPHAAAIFAALNRHNMAVGAAGDATNQNQASCCPTLATPSITVTAGSCVNVVAWGAVTNAARYDVYRNEISCTAGFTKIGSVTAPTLSYNDTSVSAGTTYYYRVQAVGTSDACVSPMSACVNRVAAACGGPCTAPGAPNFSSATGTCSGVDLVWSAGTGTSTSYNVYRKPTSCTGGTYTKIAGPVTATTYTDSTGTAGATYAYMVRGACDAGGLTESVDSTCRTAASLATVTMPSAPTITDDCTGLVISWAADAAATSFHVFRRNGGCGNNSWADQTPAGVTGTSWTDTGAASGSTYGYYIQAVNACGVAGDKANCAAGTHTLASAPSAPTITSITDDNACAQSGIRVNFTAGSGATSYNLLRNGTVVVTGYASGALYNPAATTSFTYVVRAVNGCGNTDSAGQAFADTDGTPGTPAITAITDNNACAQDGVKVAYTAGAGATRHDLYRDGALAVTGYVSNAVHNPGDTASHSYVVRAVNGTCFTNSAAQAFADGNGAPLAPAITGITDDDACAQSGVRVAYAAGSGATSHDLYRDGLSVVTGYASGALYNPGDSTSHSYVVRAINTCGFANSTAQAATDANGSPGTPSISSITDVSACAQSGIRVVYSAGSGATRHDLYRDGLLVVTNYASNATYDPADSASHSYVVRAIQGTCFTASGGQAFSDANGATTPTISGANANVCPATTVTLTTQAGMTGYQWYRNGTPISGANTNTHAAASTGTYTVSFTNGSGCSATSAGQAVTITACAPNIVYAGNGGWAEVYGNGDAYQDPGETWDVVVTLQNTGNMGATSVVASLQASGATFCTGTASYGNLAVGGSAGGTFRLVIGAAFTCGNALSFDVVGKSSSEGSYANELGAFTRATGHLAPGVPETATTADFTAPASSTTTRSLAPALATAGPSAVTATATYTANTNFNRVTSALLRHLGSGNTIALGTPTGNGIAVNTSVTAFYQANGAGTYQMEWVTGSKTVDLAAISLTVTPAGSIVCSTWSGQSCLSGAAPKPVPDGRWVAGTPLSAGKLNAAGTQVQLDWGVTCASTNYNVLYGNGSGLSTMTLAGSQCAVGATGSYAWTTMPVPSESLFWWVVVGTDGASTEGSWGKDSTGTERLGATASNQCGYSVKNTSGTCP